MHHDLTPSSVNTKKYQEKIINNFRSRSYLPPSALGTYDWSQAHLSQESLPYPSRMNLNDHRSGNDFASLLETAIPDFQTFLRNNFDGEKREKKKSKLMQVCVDRTRSTLNQVQHKKVIDLNDDDTSTSTGVNNDDDSQDSANMKMPALSSSNENKLYSDEQKDEVSSTNSVHSESLL